jgi:hypothetical protein
MLIVSSQRVVTRDIRGNRFGGGSTGTKAYGGELRIPSSLPLSSVCFDVAEDFFPLENVLSVAARCHLIRKINARSLIFVYFFFNVSKSSSNPSRLLCESGPSARQVKDGSSRTAKLSKSLCMPAFATSKKKPNLPVAKRHEMLARHVTAHETDDVSSKRSGAAMKFQIRDNIFAPRRLTWAGCRCRLPAFRVPGTAALPFPPGRLGERDRVTISEPGPAPGPSLRLRRLSPPA